MSTPSARERSFATIKKNVRKRIATNPDLDIGSLRFQLRGTTKTGKTTAKTFSSEASMAEFFANEKYAESWDRLLEAENWHIEVGAMEFRGEEALGFEESDEYEPE